MSKKKKVFIGTGVGIVIILCAVGGYLVYKHQYYEDKWYTNTQINGVDCSGMTLEESLEALGTMEYEITILGRDGGEDVITGTEISLVTDLDAQLEEAFEEQHESLFLKNLLGQSSTYTLNENFSYDKEAVTTALEESVLTTGSNSYTLTEPEDAYIEWNGLTYTVVEGDPGNILDVSAAAESICAAIDLLETSIDLESLDVYEEAAIQPEDLEALCLEANTYTMHWITWDMGADTTETLSPQELYEWVTIEEDTVTFDTEALYEWIETLCLKYKTVGITRNFTTHDGETIEISGGDYGWRIDYDDMCESTLAAVTVNDDTAITAYAQAQTESTQAALTTQLNVVWTTVAYQRDYTTFMYDWDPDNYAEVDISEQMVYIYQDGELAYSCICVTGLPDGDRDTTTGTWYVKDKQEEYTLTSEVYDYSIDTKYWIRLTWDGIGFHYKNRSDWGSWSSTLYQSAGSHGCINLQLEDAEAIYNLLEIFDVVFIHE